MTTKTQNSSSFSRFSRVGVGLGLKQSSASPQSGAKGKQRKTEEEWYIPYNGPYEVPREPLRRQRERDSWGDPLYGEEDVDTILAGQELQKLYSDGHGEENTRYSGGGDVYDDDGRNGRLRSRTQSGISGRTVSSGVVDPSRASFGTRRSTVSASQRPPVPSYINLDAVGGVGESPMPLQRASKEGNAINRASIASIFTFGVPSRKAPPSPKYPPDRSSTIRFSRKLSRPGRSSTSVGPEGLGPRSSLHRRSSSSGSNHFGQNTSGNNRRAKGIPLEAQDSDPAEVDYYNSYYSTLVTSPRREAIRGNHTLPPKPPSSAPSLSPMSPSQHPYAYVFPSSQNSNGPHTAPLTTTKAQPNKNGSAIPPRLTFSEAPEASGSAGPFAEGMKGLKNSVSTPDLRITRDKLSKAQPFFKGKDRWLSAETWCDALLFPRPRLKIKQEGIGSGRIVSPPGSPMLENYLDTGRPPPEVGMVSRVLAHSRSLADLRKTLEPKAPAVLENNPPVAQLSAPQDREPRVATLRPPRPKSFAQDDLALLSPAPSLARVLEEGKLLDDQRKEWQTQATQSFQNKRTRSISRARSKSLTQKGKRKDEPPPSNIDFLAARACLGNQSIMPVVSSREHSATHGTSSGGTFSRISHSHSNSLVKTLSRSSKSHSRGHSRTDSWGRSALKMAKSAACGLTGNDTTTTSGSEDIGSGLESALKKEGTRVIRLADPAQIHADKGPSYTGTPMTSISPTPSGTSDIRVGIALTTPPLTDNALDRDSIRIPAHPYAQAGLYSYTPVAPPPAESRPEKDSTTHHPPLAINKLNPDISSRHRLPPQAAFHPYAQASTFEPYSDERDIIPQIREDSDVPPPAKMWAQWSPGIIREILPNEIQYSPFTSERGDESVRNSRIINDTVGVGEALAYAIRPKPSKDSGLGTSEGHTVTAGAEGGKAQQSIYPGPAKRSYRQPVQYDATRPSYLTQAQRPSDPSSAHTYASSPLIHDSPPFDFKQHNPSRTEDIRGTSTSPGMTSDTSSPPGSPRDLGNPDDLEGFQDLFYRPSVRQGEQPTEMHTASPVPLSWDTGSQSRRTGSGLTSLARQLNEEFEQMALERERASSQYSQSSGSLLPSQSAFVRRPTDTSLEFVFEEASQGEFASGSASPPDHSTISAFHPSVNIPEDVESSRASSPIEPHEDETERYRVGLVEPVLTPPPVSSDHRSSHTGQMSFAAEQIRHPANSVSDATPRVNSGLQPPSANPTRSSFTTTSTTSRMSGLSDFPAPPRHHHAHMSLLSSYFDEALSQSEALASRNPTPPLPADQDRRLTFGGNEDIDDLVAALSSHHSDSSHSYS